MTPTPSPVADAAQTAAAIDPTVVALLSISLTVTAGFIGAWIQSNREHRKWLREQRYEAFLRVIGLLRQVKVLESTTQSTEHLTADDKTEALRRAIARLHELRNTLADATTPLRVLGPSYVEDALQDFFSADGPDRDEAASVGAEERLVAAMRRALRALD